MSETTGRVIVLGSGGAGKMSEILSTMFSEDHHIKQFEGPITAWDQNPSREDWYTMGVDPIDDGKTTAVIIIGGKVVHSAKVTDDSLKFAQELKELCEKYNVKPREFLYSIEPTPEPMTKPIMISEKNKPWPNSFYIKSRNKKSK